MPETKTKNLERTYTAYLVTCAQAGDKAAFTRLAQDWQRRLLVHAYRLVGDAELARDVVQDGWADIVRGLPKLNDPIVFPAWAYRIITRRAADAIKRLQRKRRTEAAFTQEPTKPDTSKTAMELSADASPLRKAIDGLPAKHAAVTALFYLEDLSVVEISIALSVPTGTVKTRLMHARQKLRASLKGKKND